MLQIKEIMTPKVELINPDTSVKDAADKMKNLNIGVLPIGENDRLVGIVTDRDITVRSVAEGQDPKTTRVEDIMSKGVTYCYDDQDVHEVTQLMKDNKIRRVIVLNRDKDMVGICSLGDLAVDVDDTELTAETLKIISHPANPNRKE
jgi:CBS domain-containing protein